MKYYAVFSDSGEILRIEHVPHRYIECSGEALDTTHYVDVESGTVKEKRDFGFDVSTSGLRVTLSGLPLGTRVSTNGYEESVDGAPLVIEYDLPGTYMVSLSGHLEHLDQEMEVTVGNP